jgi:hypothetical protein
LLRSASSTGMTGGMLGCGESVVMGTLRLMEVALCNRHPS